eukprot:1146656-Pelagomonas_calceolata.AAC.4
MILKPQASVTEHLKCIFLAYSQNILWGAHSKQGREARLEPRWKTHTAPREGASRLLWRVPRLSRWETNTAPFGGSFSCQSARGALL